MAYGAFLFPEEGADALQGMVSLLLRSLHEHKAVELVPYALDLLIEAFSALRETAV